MNLLLFYPKDKVNSILFQGTSEEHSGRHGTKPKQKQRRRNTIKAYETCTKSTKSTKSIHYAFEFSRLPDPICYFVWEQIEILYIVSENKRENKSKLHWYIYLNTILSLFSVNHCLSRRRGISVLFKKLWKDSLKTWEMHGKCLFHSNILHLK